MKPHIAIIGAGAFGSWTAYQLIQQGARVTVFDTWGPGHSRASSGGETRVIRSVYGEEEWYVNWVAEAYGEWTRFQEKWQKEIMVTAGNLWLFSTPDDAYARRSAPLIQAAGLSIEEWSVTEAQQQYSAINFAGVHSVFFEKEAGFLYARRACRAVIDAFVQLGGTYEQKAVLKINYKDREVEGLRLSDGSQFSADQYVFACGPWLKFLFPTLLANHLEISRQAICYYGTPVGQRNWRPPELPVWIDYGDQIYYGIPGAANRGFKLADDTRGSSFDPTQDSRLPKATELAANQAYLSHRFPALKDAPLIESRVCQYTNTPDGDYLIDQHPEATNAWLAGGGCGHAFKMGPMLGRYIANALLGNAELNPKFQFKRFAQVQDKKTQFDI